MPKTGQWEVSDEELMRAVNQIIDESDMPVATVSEIATRVGYSDENVKIRMREIISSQSTISGGKLASGNWVFWPDE